MCLNTIDELNVKCPALTPLFRLVQCRGRQTHMSRLGHHITSYQHLDCSPFHAFPDLSHVVGR